MFELKAIELVAAHLRNAVEDGSDPVARNGMAEAQYIAGMGFSNVGLGIVHSMAHPWGRSTTRRTAWRTHYCCPM